MAKILIVDDSLAELMQATFALAKDNHETLTCGTVWCADKVVSFKPDLILMEVEMGAASGPDAVRALAGRDFVSNTKIVLLSSLAEEELRSLADGCGADGFIIKTDTISLVRQVRGFLGEG